MSTVTQENQWLLTRDDLMHEYEIVGDLGGRPIYLRSHLLALAEQLPTFAHVDKELDFASIQDVPQYIREHAIRRRLKWILKPSLYYRPYHYITERTQDTADSGRIEHAIRSRKDFPAEIKYIYNQEHDCRYEKDLEKSFEEWEVQWEQSGIRQGLTAYLDAHADELQDVHQIICFGLGDLPHRRSYVQHLAASTIRQVLDDQQKCRLADGTSPGITLYSQDPAYCQVCKTTLKERLNIQAIDDPNGFLLINKNTFVISFSPNVPVRQIVSDITLEYGGPAGMLCNRITADHDRQGTWFDGRSEAADAVFDRFRAFTDPWSPNLEAYKTRCSILEIDDSGDETQEVFGTAGVYVKPMRA